MQEKKARIAKWDNLKFFFIACVVIGHFFARFDDMKTAKSIIFFIYTFHMPGFIFMSGLFAKKTINEKRYDKIFSFLIMFIVTKYALFLIKVISHKKLEFEYFSMNDVSWYAFAVFIFYLLTVFFKRFSPVYMMIATVIFACVTGYATDIGTYLSLSRIAVFYPIFLLGYYLKPEDILKVTGKIYVKIISAIILVAVAVISVVKIDDINWLLKILKGKFAYGGLAKYADYGGLLRLMWYVAAMIIVFAWIAVMPSVHSIFTTWGGRTMQVYTLHYIPMLLFFGMFNGSNWVQSVWPEHYLILVLIISCLVTCVLSVKPIKIVMDKMIYPTKRKAE